MVDIYEALKDIEDRLEGEEYFLELEAIFDDEDIVLEIIPEVEEDIRSICTEWHLNEEFTDLMLRASIESKGYYKVCEDCYYIAKGNVCDVFRILETDDSLLILEFYKID